jgi:predicted nuclease of predicted toxin-antitoxin system
MKLMADENVDRRVVDRLRLDGHEVVYVAELSPSMTDDDLLGQVSLLDAPLLTEDKDFGELVFRLHRAHPGVVLLRLAGLPAEHKADTVANIVAEYGDALVGAFCVISPGGFRLRRPSR